MTMSILPLLLFLLLSLWVVPALAGKDTDIGYYNPNLEDEMYWKNAINVLQDLDKFQALYIKYHSCVWSRFGNGAENAEIGCESDPYADEKYWYLGRTQCFRANVGFTLYGIIEGGNSQSMVESGGVSSNCNRHTYINSFFTTYGVESFAEPLGIDTTYANSQCTSSYAAYGQAVDSKYVSTTTGCSERGTFVTAEFGGQHCSGQHFVDVDNKLSDFNDEMDGKSCVLAYENGEYWSVAEQILYKSEACSVRMYPDRCPDPFGFLASYTRKLEKASASTAPSVNERSSWWLPFLSAAIGVSGIALLATAYRIKYSTGSNVTRKTPEDEPPSFFGRVPFGRQASVTAAAIASSVGDRVEALRNKFQPPSPQKQSRDYNAMPDGVQNPGSFDSFEEIATLPLGGQVLGPPKVVGPPEILKQRARTEPVCPSQTVVPPQVQEQTVKCMEDSSSGGEVSERSGPVQAADEPVPQPPQTSTPLSPTAQQVASIKGEAASMTAKHPQPSNAASSPSQKTGTPKKRKGLTRFFSSKKN